MDSDVDWTANALFSPSKARIAQAQAKDWSFVDAWLARKYGSQSLPSFERNEDTLQALLALATLNESADERRAAVERVEKAALQSLSKSSPDLDAEFYQEVIANLDHSGREALDQLAKLMVEFNVPVDEGVSDLGATIVQQQTDRFELVQQQDRLRKQVEALQREQSKAIALLDELKHENFQTPHSINDETVEWTRGSKQLKTKINEYDEKLSALRASVRPSLTIEDIQFQLEDATIQHRRLSDLNAQLKIFQGLPTDAREARAVLEHARDDLRRLILKREQYFEDLVPAG